MTKSLLIIASRQDNYEVVELLIKQKTEGGKIADYQQDEFQEALLQASSMRVVKLLLAAGTQFNSTKSFTVIDGITTNNLLIANQEIFWDWDFKYFVGALQDDTLQLTADDIQIIIAHKIVSPYPDDKLFWLYKKLKSMGEDTSVLLAKLSNGMVKHLDGLTLLGLLIEQIDTKVLFENIAKKIVLCDFNEEDMHEIEIPKAYEFFKTLFEKGFRPSKEHIHRYIFYDDLNCDLCNLFYSYGIPLPNEILISVIEKYHNKFCFDEKSSCLRMMENLLKLGLDPTAKDETGNSALSLALKYNYSFFVDLLIEQGCNQKLWKEEFQKRFQPCLDYFKGNPDFSSDCINDFISAHSSDSLLSAQQHFKDLPVQSITKCQVVTKLKQDAIASLPNY